MSKDRRPINDGYQPEISQEGYKPKGHKEIPTGDPEPKSGYQPRTTGDNPTNQPTSAPGDE